MQLEAEYTEDEWAASAGHRPLAEIDVNQIFLLNRHWLWSHLQRLRFYDALHDAPPPDDGAFLGHEAWASMFMWYATLWSVVEAIDKRSIELRGPMRADIDAVADPLRRFRNAVFHVSDKNQHDPRLFALIGLEDAPARISRITLGLGRLFHEEHGARKARGDFGSDTAAGEEA